MEINISKLRKIGKPEKHGKKRKTVCEKPKTRECWTIQILRKFSEKGYLQHQEN